MAAIDADASRQGLSCSEYLRRTLTEVARDTQVAVTVEDLTRFSTVFSDLADENVMRQAWR
ncbi:type II toxin-antitoxin system antitoxin VapB2 [Luedemannella flava]|uniref:Type II toxin-antitoxin system antitoxin VapB2 n=1 Tax=Luedemannella flava TaxID=349316 RepID=A0ABP4YP98_9ACTN